MTKHLICLPIEPLTERYTESWYRNIPPYFRSLGYNVTVIDGQPLVNDDIKVGTFLDVNSTVAYKSSQMQAVAAMFDRGEVAAGTTFFVFDLEFWGIEALRLLADMNGIKIHIVAFLHAASYTHGDAFEIAAPYQRFTEVGWVAMCDAVFVGSEYHKSAFKQRRLTPLKLESLADKIHVTGNPMFANDYRKSNATKEKLVLMCNRPDSEKCPLETLNLFERLKEYDSSWTFALTSSRKTLRSNSDDVIARICDMEARGILEVHVGLSKSDYHAMLGRAFMTVSHSPEESYGICIAESLIYNAIPLLKNTASHPEFIRYGARVFDTGEGNDFDTALSLMQAYSNECKPALSFDYAGMSNIEQVIAAITQE